MPESQGPKKNRIIAYFQDSYDELKKVTWPTRNQAVKLTFIVIGFCIAFALVVGVMDFVFNYGYRALVNYSEKVAPPAQTQNQQVVTGEPTPAVDLSNIKVDSATQQPIPKILLTPDGTTQQTQQQ